MLQCQDLSQNVFPSINFSFLGRVWRRQARWIRWMGQELVAQAWTTFNVSLALWAGALSAKRRTYFVPFPRRFTFSCSRRFYRSSCNIIQLCCAHRWGNLWLLCPCNPKKLTARLSLKMAAHEHFWGAVSGSASILYSSFWSLDQSGMQLLLNVHLQIK